MTTHKLKFSQGQRLVQKLYPGYLLSQRLLEMQNIEIEEEIKKQVEENPVLETEYSENPKTIGVIFADNDPFTEYLINKNLESNQSLSEQLHQEELTEAEIIIGEEIIGNLDKDGYLRRTDNELSESILNKYGFTPTPEQIEKLRNIIMRLEPAGMASRNLKECLTVQIKESDEDGFIKEKAIELINNHFDDLTHKRYEKITETMKISPETLSKILDAIHRLDPHPGYSTRTNDYIIPDIIVQEDNGKLKAELSCDESSKLKINPEYLEIANSENTETEFKNFIKSKIEKARTFVTALKERNENLKKIANYILLKQQNFFKTSGAVLEPMLEKEMADELGMDQSTVSRAVKKKYMQTPFGIFELRSFFSYPFKIRVGEDVSNKMIKQKIKEIIESEDKSSPIPDEKISELLNLEGFPVARRTVAKYREAMKIPKATLRKKLL